MSEPFVFWTEARDRQKLAHEIEFMLATRGPRVLAGTYEVSIRRLSKKEVEAAKVAKEETT